MKPWRLTVQIGKGPIARATVHTSFVLGLRMLMQAGALLLVVRLLGPEQFAAFAGMAALAVMFGTLTTFGTHLLLLREVSCDPKARPQWLTKALTVSLFSGTLVFVVYLLLTLFWLKPDGLKAEVLVAIAISDILAVPLLQLPAVIRQGIGQITSSQLLLVLPQGMRFLAAIAVLLYQPDNMLSTYALAYALAALVCIPIGIKAMPYGLPSWRDWRWPTWEEWRETSGFAALNLSAFGPGEIDKTLALHLLPAIAAGSYAAASRVLGPLALPVLAMMIAVLPKLFREHFHGVQGSRLERVVLLVALGYGICAATALWLVAPLIAQLFGTDYIGLIETLRWLTLALPLMAVRYAIGNILMARNAPWLRWRFEIAGMSALFFAAIILTVANVPQSLPLALAISEITMAIFGFFYINRHEYSNRASKTFSQ